MVVTICSTVLVSTLSDVYDEVCVRKSKREEFEVDFEEVESSTTEIGG